SSRSFQLRGAGPFRTRKVRLLCTSVAFPKSDRRPWVAFESKKGGLSFYDGLARLDRRSLPIGIAQSCPSPSHIRTQDLQEFSCTCRETGSFPDGVHLQLLGSGLNAAGR